VEGARRRRPPSDVPPAGDVVAGAAAAIPTSPRTRAGTSDDVSDERLVAAHRAGRAHAFDLLVARHGARVRAYARRVLDGDEAAADDVTQDAFLALLERPPAPEPGAGFIVWLLRVTRNGALDHMRRRGRIDRLKARVRERLEALARRPGSGAEAAPPSVLAHEELARAFDEAVAELPEPRRSVFLLREVEGLSYEEIGEVVGCAPKTVSTRLARARAALRERLAEHAEGGDVASPEPERMDRREDRP